MYYSTSLMTMVIRQEGGEGMVPNRKWSKEDYNAEPVVYCSKCYSLSIMYEGAVGIDCCRECGCPDTETASIEEWEKLYKERYGHDFISEEGDVRKSPLFSASFKELKNMLYDSPSWREICKSIYPSFPEGLSRADSVILLFAKAVQDNRIDDLRMELIKNQKQEESNGEK